MKKILFYVCLVMMLALAVASVYIRLTNIHVSEFDLFVRYWPWIIPWVSGGLYINWYLNKH